MLAAKEVVNFQLDLSQGEGSVHARSRKQLNLLGHIQVPFCMT